MYRPYKILTYLSAGFLAFALLFSACKKDEEASTGVELFSFGPSPALRGGELKIIGANLDRVSAVVLPDNVNVTSFNTRTTELITLTIPEETVEGKIILKTPEGDITSISRLSISEPIILASFSPETARPGDLLTIQGDYLNLIRSVIFSSEVSVGDTLFVSQSKEKIEVKVPEAAQTGLIAVSNGEEEPIIVESEKELSVTVPQVLQLSPNPVKAGTVLTIQGTDLDLARQVGFEGTSVVTSFVSQSADKIEVNVPADAHDGKILLIPGSFVEVPSAEELIMVVPQITDISPNPVKNGENVTVTGADLDLVTRVVFGGNKVGAILGGGTATEIRVKVPISATEDVVLFRTAAEKEVASAQALQLVRPVITGFTPSEARFGEEISIEGEDLDLVSSVIFTGAADAVPVNNALPNAATVDVPVGALTGPLTVVMINGTQVASAFDFNILLSTNAVITDMPAMAAPGDMISIVGENLDELNEVIFPGEVPATMFGQKTATLIEVFVPMGTATGVGNIKFITFDGEEFFSPPINIQGVDPVADPTLVFFNFDGLDSWWGDTGGIENDPGLSLDGSNYFRVNASLSGWTGFFWRNGGDNFPGAVVGAGIGDYVLKFDINVLEPITGGEFAWRLKGSDGDFWRPWKPWEGTGSFMTDGWITITIPLTEFLDGGNQIPNLANITEDFGVAFNNGDSFVNVCIDNVRFEAR
ncbi:MAG: IPT/TIG domain-containing protein [Phaeodactylibacter sp.]|nr:IPT/TIG domain-containing protein [Phaeodactylibacter sp.]MCB9266598.1 IPT/TIG domain-containing protein [Lewinellaceae bacterium]MCB9286689.1 IPT/TIG domain-containing protein [Lewinellaceae bacterium]